MIKEPTFPKGESRRGEPRSVLDMIANPVDIMSVQWAELDHVDDRMEAIASIVIDLPEDNAEERKQQHNITLENYMKLALRAAGNRDVALGFLNQYATYLDMDDLEDVDAQIKRAQDGLTVWGPLAEVCGDVGLKNQIEDLSFGILYPDERAAIMATYEELGGNQAFSEFLDVHLDLLGEHLGDVVSDPLTKIGIQG